MKMLLVSWGLLPRPGGSSMVVENLAQNFSRDELVLLGGARFSQEEPVRKPSFPKVYYHFTEININGKGDRFFTWIRKFRFNSLVRKIEKVIQIENIGYVLAVYPDAFFCLAACRAAKNKGIPFSSYFHNTYVENTAITDPLKYDIQKEIFDTSEFVFVMHKGMQQFFIEKYGLDKFRPLVHTFAEYPEKNAQKKRPEKNKKHYKLVSIGNFNESNMEATIRFAKAIANNPKYSLHIYTHVPSVLLKLRGLNPNWYEHKGFAKLEELPRLIQEHDFCLLTHGFVGGYGELEYKTIFPTRTIPFLLSGNPMIVHSPSGSFLNDFIKENQCAELIDQPTTDSILNGLERVSSDPTYQQALIDAAAITAHQFHGLTVTNYLKIILKIKNMS